MKIKYIILFLIFPVYLSAQDTAKYRGGSYDGFTNGNISESGLDGTSVISAKYYGGSYDGFTNSNISQSGLNGIAISSAKYYGGSYDGFTNNNISQSGLNGTVVTSAKYNGGSYDGFSNDNISQSGLNGTVVISAKYNGGSYDGFTKGDISQSGLNGTVVISAKYYGGSYDGFTNADITQSGLNGTIIIAVKYSGGSFDGYANGNITETGLNGITISSVRFSGGSYDGYTVMTTDYIPLENAGINLSIKLLIEGLYDETTDKMFPDTVKIYLRSTSPGNYSVKDTAVVPLDSSGCGNIYFRSSLTGTYYVQIKHRNALETWSKEGGTTFLNNFMNSYDFTTDSAKAYGNNMIKKGTKWCLYSGDCADADGNRGIQDGFIDANDMSVVDNDSYIYLTGWEVTDLNGDLLIDLNDMALIDNNSYNYISVIRPPDFPGNNVIKTLIFQNKRIKLKSELKQIQKTEYLNRKK